MADRGADPRQRRHASPTITGRGPALAVSSSPATPTLTQQPGPGFTGSVRGTGPHTACRRVSARNSTVWVANTSGTSARGAAAIAGASAGVATALGRPRPWWPRRPICRF
jgi:hypothetical protein